MAFNIVREIGKNNLHKGAGVAKLYAESFYDKATDIEYDGKIYKYNSDIITFLVMGIDSDEKVPEVDEDTDYLMGGQSDALFLNAYVSMQIGAVKYLNNAVGGIETI